jgi:hypothetical protein
VAFALETLPDWRDLDELRYSSSPGMYRTECESPLLQRGETARLNMQWVYGAAEVYINGRHAGSLLVPPYTIEIGTFLTQGMNVIEIEMIPALRNRLIGKALQGDEAYREFSGKGDTLLPVGIKGPIVLEFRSQ